MRSAAIVAVTCGWLCAACLDTEPDAPNDSAPAGRAGSTGSDKPPLAPSSAGGHGAAGSASSIRSKTAAAAQAGSSAARPASQPSAAGARAVSGPPKASGAGGAAGSDELPAVPSPKRAGDLVITELMIDPETLPDSQGEWFELYNASSNELSLHDCKLDDGVKTLHSISDSLRIQPGEYATLARGPNPGFTPSAVVALSLTNSADSLAIICGGVEIDRVTYAKAAGFAIQPGVTLSLDPDALSAQQNDLASAWCAGQNLYNDDFGTPGRPNPSCASEPPDEADAGAEAD